MKPRIKSMIQNIRKQKQPIRTTRKKNPPKLGQYKQPLGQLQEVQHSHHRGARRSRERARIGNLFEKITKENFPNLVKEIDMQVQEAHRVPNKMDAKRTTLRHIIIKMPNVKYKERMF